MLLVLACMFLASERPRGSCQRMFSLASDAAAHYYLLSDDGSGVCVLDKFLGVLVMFYTGFGLKHADYAFVKFMFDLSKIHLVFDGA
eukprot:4351390-Amphidinium_carterae.1